MFIYRYIKNTIKSHVEAKIRQRQWRNLNRHNLTILENPIHNYHIITVGKGSYGPIDATSYENSNEKLIIGNYVSIAKNVQFILGGNHQIDTFTTYPLKAMYLEPCCEQDATTKGEIIIEDEVWLGANSIILSGVTIGKGAIVAAGSVVTKDVPPYTIVGGNPAKFIKNRVPETLIPLMNDIYLNDLDIEKVKQNIDLFYQPIDEDVLSKIKGLK